MSTSAFTVTGMTCNGCANKVKGELGKVEGVSGVEVELATGRVTVTSQDVEDARIIDAVEELGYEAVPV
ncbi:heavy metal-associated domain-containing protein [Nonomuraea longicatena]|uniref:Heavy-metal-associated domain-containing protein n=1 Tax=Nonomuraea longicatena TaxID=83682 RepID=A0ABP3Z0K6_9ACTN